MMIFVFTRSLITSRRVSALLDCFMQLDNEPGLVASLKKQILRAYFMQQHKYYARENQPCTSFVGSDAAGPDSRVRYSVKAATK